MQGQMRLVIASVLHVYILDDVVQGVCKSKIYRSGKPPLDYRFLVLISGICITIDMVIPGLARVC